MRTIKNLMIAIALLLTVNNSIFATETNIQVVGKKTFVLSIQMPTSALTIRLIDNNNVDLYNQSVNTVSSDYKQKFDLSSLPNGVYKLKVEDVIKVTTVLVKIENDKIVSNDMVTEATIKPAVFVRGQNLYVNGIASVENPIQLNIYQAGYGLVYNELLSEGVEKGRMFKFKYTGDYTVNVTSKGKTYSYEVSVKNNSKTKEQIISINE